jgi:hypothetical protein
LAFGGCERSGPATVIERIFRGRARCSLRIDPLTWGGQAMRNHLQASLAWLVLAALAQAAPAAQPVTLPEITVRVLPGTAPSILHDLEHLRPARGAEPVTLQLDLAHQRVLNAAGRIVAGPDATRTAYLQSVVDKWRYVAALAALARAHPQELRSDWGDDGTPQAAPLPWVAGTDATFTIPHVPPQRQLRFFGIGPRGDIYFLRPQKIALDEAGDTMIVRAIAVPPFGAEHLVAVTAMDPAGMRALGTWLAETSDSRGPIDTQGEILRQIQALKDVRIGLLASYTCRTAPECIAR